MQQIQRATIDPTSQITKFVHLDLPRFQSLIEIPSPCPVAAFYPVARKGGFMTTIATSAAKCAANQKNSQRSTGPVTAEGKAKIRYNALRQDLLADRQPADTQKSSLVTEIAGAASGINRAWRIETETYDNSFEAARLTEDPDGQTAACFHGNAKSFNNLHRYSTNIERACYRAITELRKLQKAGKTFESGSVSVRQEKPGRSSDLKGDHHVNYPFDM